MREFVRAAVAAQRGNWFELAWRERDHAVEKLAGQHIPLEIMGEAVVLECDLLQIFDDHQPATLPDELTSTSCRDDAVGLLPINQLRSRHAAPPLARCLSKPSIGVELGAWARGLALRD